MRKKIFLSFLLLNSIIANNTHAADDRISNLILKVNAKANNNADIDLIENKLLGRASWKIKCQYKVFEDMKACVMSKGPISILGGVSKSMLKQSRLNFDKIEKCE